METTALDLNATYCRWAEARYGLTEVTAVRFDSGAHGPYSDVTPDVDPYVEVVVNHAGGLHTAEENYVADLINDLLAFAVRSA